MPGTSTFPVEVSHVSVQGFWLWLGSEEVFLSFKDFPWFKSTSIGQLCHLERPTEDHLYWPDLDVDLSIESIKNPAAFPLVSTSPTS